MEKAEGNKGFSWLGLFFGGAYYAGYGQWAKGLIMAILSFIPLTAIPVNIYAGLKAKKQLPVGEQAFEWPKAVLIFIVPILLGLTVVFFTQGGATPYTEADFRKDISGYWESSRDEVVLIDLKNEPYKLGVSGQVVPVRIKKVEAEEKQVFLELQNGNIVAFSFLDDGTLMFVSGNSESYLTFVRDL